jgi:hypothetical protein
VDSQGGVLPPFMAWLLCGDHRCKDKMEGVRQELLVPSAENERSRRGGNGDGKQLDRRGEQGSRRTGTSWDTPDALPARDGFNRALTPNKRGARMRLGKAFQAQLSG